LQNNTFLTLFVGQSLVKLSETNSTNDYLKKLLSNFKPLTEGTVIMADHQSAGRGQQNNVWEAEKGKNLTISILLNPTFLSLNQQFYLNKVVSLGINDCLRTIVCDDCKIKWPNDIYHKNQKIGGVLIENIVAGNYIKNSIIGIGINVNQQNFSHLAGNATSLVKILRKDYELNDLLRQLCKSIESRYLQAKAKHFERLDSDYLGRLFGLNEVHNYLIGDEIVQGKVVGVSAIGLLLLQINDEVKEFDLKQVKLMLD